ncbi:MULTISPECIES: hypothetical protein [Cupriavidus]|uniref:hypothetical protein n=1 Tax=Cupriavidus sp. DF5525 TaxID=3160989 RepID=UPI0032DF844D
MAGPGKVPGDGRAAQRYVVNDLLQGYCFVTAVARADAATAAVVVAAPDAALLMPSERDNRLARIYPG